jgi:hypothetical protein
MTMGEIADFETGFGREGIDRKLRSMIDWFFDQSVQLIHIDPMDEEFGPITLGMTGKTRRYRDMAKWYSLHKLQQEPVFTTPVTASMLGNGRIKIEPGTTRMLFGDSRPEVLDVMLTSYQGEPLPEHWVSCHEYELTQYDNLTMQSYPFFHHEKWRWGWSDEDRYFKEIIADINNQFRVSDIQEPFTMLRTRNKIAINGVTICEEHNGMWRIVG